ncbi:MAG: hypothetical protein ACJAWQ_002210 [Paraglaciecola sp.]
MILSVLGAITLNTLIAVNHKPGRYQAYIESKKTKKDQNDDTLEKDLSAVIK